MTREKEQDNNLVEKKGFYLLKEIKKRRRIAKRGVSADLTIAFVLVTVLSVSCSFGGWSVQIQRLEGEFWVPAYVESLMGWPSSNIVCHMLLLPTSSAVKIPRYIVGVKREKKSISLKNACMCCGTVDVLIAAQDWLLFQPITWYVKSESVNNFQYYILYNCQLQILDDVAWVSHSVNTLGKGRHQTILPSAMSR